MKLFAALLGPAALAISSAVALTPPGDGSFNGTAQCVAFAPQPCGNFNGTLLPGSGYPIFLGYADEAKKNATYNPCEAFEATCKARLSGAIPMIEFGCQPLIKEKSVATAYCTEYRHHGGTWDVSGVIAFNAKIYQVVRQKPGVCTASQPGWCRTAPSEQKEVGQP